MIKRILLLLILLPAMSLAAHITDKLLVGMYATPSSEEQPLQLLPSGTPVDLKGEQDGFVKVELVDGKTGWVEKRFLSEEKPANVRLLALQSKYRQLQNKLDMVEADDTAVRDVVAVKKSEQSLRLALADAKTTIQQLKSQQAAVENKKSVAELAVSRKSEQALKVSLTSAKLNIKKLEKQLNEKEQRVALRPQIAKNQKRESEENSTPIYPWLFSVLLLLAGLALGVKKGMQIQDKRQRNRHGGFRI